MKQLALLDENNKVLNIVIADDNWESVGYVEYTNNNLAFIDGYFIEGYFYPPQPFASWIRDNGNWQPPTPRPTEGFWYWDEPTLTWIESTIP